jgi:glycine cleavage system H protein
MATPEDLLYTDQHEWLLVDGESARVGITAYAAEKLGDVVFVELPAVGAAVSSGRVVGEIESTKSVGELFAPVDGTITEVNEAVVAQPELINGDPFGDGWLIAVRFAELPELMTFAQYQTFIGE